MLGATDATHAPVSSLLTSPVFTWLTSGAVVTAASIGVNVFWERRRLNRTERAHAYSAFLAAASRQWRAFGDRDGAHKRGEQAVEEEADKRVRQARDDMYEAYTLLQVLGSQEVVGSALAYIRMADDRNRSTKGVDGKRGMGVDERAELLAEFVCFARNDLGLAALDRESLRRPKATPELT